MPTVHVSIVAPAEVDEVWAYVRDFANLAEWLPPIETCEIESGDPGAPGCVRRATGARGEVYRERLLALSDVERSYTYEFVESPFPVRVYRSTMRVAPVTVSGGTFIEWSAGFEADAKDEESMTKVFTEGVYVPGLESLRARFSH